MAVVDSKALVARFVLQPCKIRENRVVPSGEENVVLGLAEFVKKFTITGERQERGKMRAARVGAFIGVCTGSRTKEPTLFVIWREDRFADIKFLLRKDPTFPDRCHAIFKVIEADWGSRIEEPFSGKKDIPTWKAIPGSGSVLMEHL